MLLLLNCYLELSLSLNIIFVVKQFAENKNILKWKKVTLLFY